ncbi:hypothetical protein DRO54_01350 [Candidatus Bathyarchaeota archaeon]|nr:MAG: hypothetical protein DRO54_01350 [Candidatus Bathyarchaeota archaeon]
MPVPFAMVARFFQLVENRQFAEAERELERIKRKMEENEWNRGYLKALSGVLLSTKINDDQYSFLSKINLKDGKNLREYRKEFLRQVNNRLREDYDKGFFSAWADYMRVLIRMRKQEEKALKEVNDPPKRQKNEKGQTSIEHFVS